MPSSQGTARRGSGPTTWRRQVRDDVRVRGEIHVLVHGSARPLLAARLGDSLGPDPAVAVPLGPAVPQPDAVHHARAEEPAVVRVIQAERIRAVAKIAPGQLGGQSAGHRQVKGGGLLGHRREGSLEKTARVRHLVVLPGVVSRAAWDVAVYSGR